MESLKQGIFFSVKKTGFQTTHPEVLKYNMTANKVQKNIIEGFQEGQTDKIEWKIFSNQIFIQTQCMEEHTSMITTDRRNAHFRHNFQDSFLKSIPIVSHLVRPIFIIMKMLPNQFVSHKWIYSTGAKANKNSDVMIFHHIPG